MLGGGVTRISHHIRECDLHFHFPLCFTRTYSASPPFHTPSPRVAITSHRTRSMATPSKSPGEIPLLFDSFSQQEDEREILSDGTSPLSDGIVALGKFDALHIGHRELAIQASRAGPPFLLSFVGMAKVLGWELRLLPCDLEVTGSNHGKSIQLWVSQCSHHYRSHGSVPHFSVAYGLKTGIKHRAPVVAKCDRKRVLSSWVSYCCNMVPEEFQISVLQLLVGENYRFGYKAAGDALELVKLCEEYGIEAYIIKSVMDKNRCSVDMNSATNSKERGQVSSTRVREALAVGDMKYVSELLGRPHRLILMATDQERFSTGQYKVSAPRSCLLNLAPKEGLYEKCSILLDQENVAQCRVVIDSKFVHIETDYGGLGDFFGSQNLQFLHIEFGDSCT
ncbi:hypothetical protein Fmac_023016 [Flemingia macrophylla]|uniref:FAD synthase n=1 Tax=Flemingia macrophylla TaxID=520843 RepID=A0ABD1LKU7_9FABA